MVKLQRQKAYVYRTESGEKVEHFKHTIIIPVDTIQQLGWKKGVELTVVPKGDALTLRPQTDAVRTEQLSNNSKKTKPLANRNREPNLITGERTE